jgi:ATP phosphoribosyltransferase regulatory subunit
MSKTTLGLRDYLPKEVEARDQRIHAMKAIVQGQGYARIITPSIEHYDPLEKALGQYISKQSIMFFDGAGNRLVLRPDHSIAVARIVSSRMADQLPIKLFYHDPVFRKDALLGETEIVQFGCEHIGSLSMADEAAMVATIIQVCQAVGVDDIEIHASHPELFKGMSEADIQALASGQLSALQSLPTQGTQHTEQNGYFNAFYKELNTLGIADKVFVHHGLHKDLSYYNGVFFDVVSRSHGQIIGSGGRYDTILNAFGVQTNAVGFSLRLHALEKAAEHE